MSLGQRQGHLSQMCGESSQAASILSHASWERVVCMAKTGRSRAVKLTVCELLGLKGFKGRLIQPQPSDHLADIGLCLNPDGVKYIHLFVHLLLYHSLRGGPGRMTESSLHSDSRVLMSLVSLSSSWTNYLPLPLFFSSSGVISSYFCPISES